MSTLPTTIKDGAHILAATGSADAFTEIESAELWQHAVVYDRDDGATILRGFTRLCDAAEEGDFDVSCCAQCGKKVEELNDGEYKTGTLLSLGTYGGADEFLTQMESVECYICPTCCQPSSADPVKTLLGKLIGDLDGLRYVKID